MRLRYIICAIIPLVIESFYRILWSMKTYYIVPSWSDQAGQCRIVSREGKIQDARADYQDNPRLWAEAGIMNSRGALVCLDGRKEAWAVFKDCEPLMAGMQVTI